MKLLRKTIGFYELSELPDNYVIGHTLQDYNNGLDILVTDEMIAFKELNPTATYAEIIKMQLVEKPTKTLDQVKFEKIQEAENYYNSDEINLVSIQGYDLYLDPDLRFKIKERLDAAKTMGLESTVLNFGQVSLPISITDGIKAYSAIVIQYATAYDVLQNHISIVNNFTTIEEVGAYNVTINYPNKLAL